MARREGGKDEEEEDNNTAVHVMHTCTGRRRDIILFLGEIRPGASGASWIRFETAGTSFVCIYILPTTYLYYIAWMEWLNSYLAKVDTTRYRVYNTIPC
jgi:hypothetical protein